MKKSCPARLIDRYRTIAVVVLNTIVLMILLNVIIEIAFLLKDQFSHRSQELFDADGKPFDNGKRSSYQLKWFDYTAYERLVDASYAGNVLDDFFNLSRTGFIYQPWVQFSEPPYHGKLVNVDVDSRGFPVRRTLNSQNGQSAAVLIFALGGSSTFGYNISDEHTWPSYLSAILNERESAAGTHIQARVMNYGRAFYDTSQEIVLLIDLLKSGFRPQLVIFMDGVNWGSEQDVPHFTDRLDRVFSDLQSPSLNHLSWVPLIRLSSSLKHRLFTSKMESEGSRSVYLRYFLNRFAQNRMIAIRVCKQYSVKPLFFLQPDPIYNYPIDLYRESPRGRFLQDRLSRQQFYAQMRTTDGIIDLTNLFELWGHNRKAIVDDVHYSPNFNRFLAQHVARYIDLESLRAESPGTDIEQSTGGPRGRLRSAAPE